MNTRKNWINLMRAIKTKKIVFPMVLLMSALSASAQIFYNPLTAIGSAQSTPANPAGTADLTGVMMGLAGSVTPKVTGRILIVVSGTILNSTLIGDGGSVQIRYGTGTAPANGAALTGTAVGGKVQYISSTTAGKVPFSTNAVVTGLSVSTALWVDVGAAAIVGGTASITDVSVSVIEF